MPNRIQRNLMMKIIAACFLFICGLIILLATVDLEPYLAPDRPVIPEQLSPPPVPKIVELPSKQTERPSTVISDGDQTSTQSEDIKLEDITTEREHGPTPPMAKVDEIAEGTEQEQTSSDLIELEVTILPVDVYPFSILLETFLEQESAQQAIHFYQKRGISAHWVKVDLEEKGIRYRLFTGVFSTVSEAQQYLDQNQLSNKLIKPTYYSARIGVYQDQAQLARDFAKASAANVIPYILGTQKGDYHLFVGAFYTFIGAINKCRDLAEAGLSCEPVKRSTIPPQ